MMGEIFGQDKLKQLTSESFLTTPHFTAIFQKLFALGRSNKTMASQAAHLLGDSGRIPAGHQTKLAQYDASKSRKSSSHKAFYHHRTSQQNESFQYCQPNLKVLTKIGNNIAATADIGQSYEEQVKFVRIRNIKALQSQEIYDVETCSSHLLLKSWDLNRNFIVSLELKVPSFTCQVNLAAFQLKMQTNRCAHATFWWALLEFRNTCLSVLYSTTNEHITCCTLSTDYINKVKVKPQNNHGEGINQFPSL